MEEPLSLVLGEGSWASRLISALKFSVYGVYVLKHSFYTVSCLVNEVHNGV